MNESTRVNTGDSGRTHEAAIDNSSRSTLQKTERFMSYISEGWSDRPEELPAAADVAPFAADRRRAITRLFPGQRLVIEAGVMKQRSNDTFYPFRAHSAFAHLTGWGANSEPGAVLVIKDDDSTLYFREAAGRDSDEFFANPEIGEFWIGARPTLGQVSALLGIRTAPLDAFAALESDLTLEHEVLSRAASELRLVKDSYELAEMQQSVDATAEGFNEVLRSLPLALSHPRGERVVEGAFNLQARMSGNTVGYETIAAAGPHACTLHWVRNDGPVLEGDLLLLDAGIELDSLYTADITRTIPVSGRFTDVQRKVYDAVLEAADAAHAIVRPGIRFRDVHNAAMAVIERKTREWGFLPEQDPDDATQYHRRYMVHGTSHHLGLDVHDCAQARREMYHDGIVQEGMVFTIEPGLYFQPDDLTVPEEYRGIGVRIEDDIVVTADGSKNLSHAIPRTADDVECWVAEASNRTS